MYKSSYSTLLFTPDINKDYIALILSDDYYCTIPISII